MVDLNYMHMGLHPTQATQTPEEKEKFLIFQIFQKLKVIA